MEQKEFLIYHESEFTTVEKIGEGSFGNVYLIEDPKTKIKYALKKVEKNKTLINLQSLIAEINSLSKCTYPTILKLYGSGRDTCYSLITEY